MQKIKNDEVDVSGRNRSGKPGFPWGWLVLGVVVGAGVYWGPGLFHKGAAPQAGMPAGAGVPVSTATVVSKNVTVWSEFSGMLQSVNAVELRPRVSGQIMQVHFADGEQVKKGQLLFTIDPRPYEAELARAKGAFAAAQSGAENAKLNLARAQKLIKGKAISQSEFEERNSGAQQSIGNYESAKGALQAAQVNLDYTRITAPISGKISRAEITAGNLVDAGGNAPLLASIVALAPIYASFDIDEQTFLATIQGVPAAKLKQIPVEVGLSNEQGTPTKAVIHAFDNQITPGSGTIRVRALIANKDERLVPGLYARIRLGTPDEAEAVLINPTAINTDQDKKFVMLVGEGNKATYTPVTLGGVIDGLQLVKTGLKAGDQIVVNGLQRIRPNAVLAGTPVDMTTLQPLNPPAEAPPSTDAAGVK
ncbi:MAG: efflux RND transporter periplasmic adaptor subunit [Pseudomonadota bacterium]